MGLRLRQTVSFVALSGLLSCGGDLPPQTFDSGPADSRQDALLGTVGAESGVQRPIPRDANPPVGTDSGPPPVDAAPEPCAPFSRVGTCAICNADGMPEAPESDGTCPPIECPESLFYEREENNGEEEQIFIMMLIYSIS